MSYDKLLKETFKTMIDSGIRVKVNGGLPDLAQKLSMYMGKEVHVSTISNALSGYRTGKRSTEVLEALQTMLSSINGDYTHQNEKCN